MVGPPVIVTRAEPGLSETCARLTDMGYQALPSPALELIACPDEPLDLAGVTDLIFTSANGIRFFCQRSEERQQTAWCVGPSTARAAREAGFGDVRASSGNSVDLCNFILAHEAPPTGPILHVANAAAAGDVLRRLGDQGLEARFSALYETKPTAQMHKTAQSLLENRQAAILLIHSAKGAAAFRAQAAGLNLSDLTIVAISKAAATPLMGCGARAVVIADAPNEDALIRALETASLTL